MCVGFSQAFGTISRKILVDGLLMYGLDKQTARGIENWLKGQPWRVVISITTSRWRPVTSSKFAGDAELKGAADKPEDHAAVQWDTRWRNGLTGTS